MIEEGKIGATVDEMERALDKLVGEIIKLRHETDKNRDENQRRQAQDRSGPAQTLFKSSLDLIARSPVEGALRLACREIGAGLFAVLQSPQRMLRVAKNVCSQDEINWSKRMTIIDAAWEGIGSDAKGYWG